jgi:hypothetical protein
MCIRCEQKDINQLSTVKLLTYAELAKYFP